ncbi:hypothetical protein DPN68_04210 [Flavobacterium tibetense]|uniref:Uncharacterized protein n=1 Tax=Flavobacterium tibetense TaxID=2233533 RepID=A0A365P362_9FLAO|nr:hypothetical protein DPN68_04210 [Flavobacterium tibetense]
MVFAFFWKRVKNKDKRFVLIGTRMIRMHYNADFIRFYKLCEIFNFLNLCSNKILIFELDFVLVLELFVFLTP